MARAKVLKLLADIAPLCNIPAAKTAACNSVSLSTTCSWWPSQLLHRVRHQAHRNLSNRPQTSSSQSAASPSTPSTPSSALPSSTPRGTSRLDTGKAWLDQATPYKPVPPSATSHSQPTGPIEWLQSHGPALDTVPPVPKALGFAGALPFIFLSAGFTEGLQLQGYIDPGWIDLCAKAQVAYAAVILSFLGAVHWGVAMTTSTGLVATRELVERYVWSIVPALAAWPLTLMDAGPAALCGALVLGICYVKDRLYVIDGIIPKWYYIMRGYLTFLATLSLVVTGEYYIRQEGIRLRVQEAERAKTVETKRQHATLPPLLQPSADSGQHR